MNFAYQLTSLFTNIVWRSKSDRISRETLSESASKAGKNREAATSQKPNCRIVHGTTCVQSKVLGCNAVNARTCSLWFQVRIFFVLFNSATDFGNSKNLSIKTNRFKFKYLFSKTTILFGDPTSKRLELPSWKRLVQPGWTEKCLNCLHLDMLCTSYYVLHRRNSRQNDWQRVLKALVSTHRLISLAMLITSSLSSSHQQKSLIIKLWWW